MDDQLIGTTPVHALIIGLVLLSLTVPIALRVAQRDGQRWLAALIMGSLLLHFLGSMLQIVIVRFAYSNAADFHLYDGEGALLSRTWHSGVWSLAGLDLDIPGTGMVSIITGAVYFVAGIDQLGGFFIFTWFGLLGLICFYRAFRTVLPTGDHKRYAALLFLLPSLFYWPSAAGKEAVMMLSLGLMILGAAQIFTHRLIGVVPMFAGSVLGGLIRPHEVALLFGAFAVGLLTRQAVRRTLLTPVRWVVTFLVVAVVGTGLALVTADFLGIPRFSVTALVDTLTETNTSLQGDAAASGTGSSFIWNSSPLYYPLDVYYVLFKPLPIEVRSATQAFAALENLTIMALIAASWRSLASVPRRLRDSPFVVMCITYTIGFIYIFSALGNVGLIARERTLLFPLLFALLALPRRSTTNEATLADPGQSAPLDGVTSSTTLLASRSAGTTMVR